MRFFKSIFLISSMLVNLQAHADDGRRLPNSFDPTEMKVIMQIVGGSDGVISRDIHEHFWTSPTLLGELPEKDKPRFAQKMSQVLDASIKLQKEVWSSVLLTLDRGVITYTPGYKNAESNAHKVLGNSGPVRESLANIEKVIQAALNKKPVDTPLGKAYITKEMAEAVVTNLDSSIERLSILANEQWPPERKERDLSRAHVKVLHQLPFYLEHSKEEVGGFQILTSTYTADSVDSAVAFAWSELEMIKVHYDPEDADNAVLEGLASFGVSSSDVTVSRIDWRDLNLSRADSSFIFDGAPYHVTISAIPRNDLGGILVVITSSNESLAKASLMHQELFYSMQLMD